MWSLRGGVSQGGALGWANGWAFGPEIWALSVSGRTVKSRIQTGSQLCSAPEKPAKNQTLRETDGMNPASRSVSFRHPSVSPP